MVIMEVSQSGQNFPNQETLPLKDFLSKRGGREELAKSSVVYPRDPDSNLSSDRKYLHIMFVSHLNPNLLGVNS
jgi:hypothetical protein